VGFSLGALVINDCLKELAKDPIGCFGLIKDVYLFGLPAKIILEDFCRSRMLVAGRFVHAYSKNDWVLTFFYRGSSLNMNDIAGLNPVPDTEGLESIDFSEIVSGHLDYKIKLPELLRLVGLDVNADSVEVIVS